MKKWGLFLEDSLIKEYEESEYNQALKDIAYAHTALGEFYQLKYLNQE